jgi:protein TonB
MSAVLAPPSVACPSKRTALACLALVVAAHAAVLALLPADDRIRSAPQPPLTVTLLVPPPAAPKAIPSPGPAEPPAVQAATRAPRPEPAQTPRMPRNVESSPAKPSAPEMAVQRAQSDLEPPPVTVPAAPAAGPEPPDLQARAPAAAPAPAPVENTEKRAVQPVSPPRFDAAYLDNPKPDYPRLARRLGEQGTVQLNVYVSATGVPEKIELHASSGSPRLDQAARETVRRWTFVPARQGERPVGAWIVVPIRFVLEG